MRLQIMLFVLGLLFCSIGFSHDLTAEQALTAPRKIMALYDGAYEGDPRYTRTHRFLEMPLNYLGYVVDYHDIADANLPDLEDEYRGVIVWFSTDTSMNNPEHMISWLEKRLDRQQKVLIMGGIGAAESYLSSPAGLKRVNELMHRIGVHDSGQWINLVHDTKIIYQDAELTDFERRYKGEIRPHSVTKSYGADAVSHLTLETPKNEDSVADVIVTSPRGGYVAEGYALAQMYNTEGETILEQWYLNPFIFLRHVFDEQNIPKPDTTTFFGKRIFYSYLDGDGWNNLTEIEKYKGRKVISAEALYDEVFKPYNDFGFTVGLIVSELRPDCYGVPDSLPVAKKILALPNVEAGSHTYSHPLYWGFYAKDGAKKEEAYKDLFPPKPNKRFFLSDLVMGEPDDEVEVLHHYKHHTYAGAEQPYVGIRDPNTRFEDVMKKYKTPRSYACESFDLDREVRGSVEYINSIVPGKEVKLYQWSGNTTPFEDAIRATRELGIPNINGGDSRFDAEYPSYANVSALSTPVGGERQIYSSNSNENTYTHLWTDRFFGFRYLQTTVLNTESPIRVAPFNIYFHTYSGEKQAGLTAVKENLDFARRQDIIPIFSSEYAKIATSFFGVKLQPIAAQQWKVINKGDIQTIRFDKATLLEVDFSESYGVIGQTHHQGALYVMLTNEPTEPVIALKERKQLGFSYDSAESFLLSSNWQIKDLQKGKESLMFKASGFGEGNIALFYPKAKDVKIQLTGNDQTQKEMLLQTDIYNRLNITFDKLESPVKVTISQKENE